MNAVERVVIVGGGVGGVAAAAELRRADFAGDLTLVAGDLLVVGVGTVPNTELAERAGLAVGNGVLVDEFCATSVPGIYAIGDVAGQQPEPSVEPVIRRSLAEQEFSAFTLDDGRVRSVIALNRPKDVLDTRRLIAIEHHVTADQLRDDTTPLKRLARPQRAIADR